MTVSESLVDVELIELTMANNEVYIGFPQGIKLNDEYIKIAPHFSGYRDSETQVLEITSKYYKIPQRRNLYISVKVKDVISVRIFDLGFFSKLDKVGRIIEYEGLLL